MKAVWRCIFFFTEPSVIPPARWLASCVVPIVLAIYGYRRKSVDITGAMLGFIVGFILTLSNFCFITALIIFFLTSSKATKFRSHLKKKVEEDFKEGRFIAATQFIACLLLTRGLILYLLKRYFLDLALIHSNSTICVYSVDPHIMQACCMRCNEWPPQLFFKVNGSRLHDCVV